MRNSSNVIIVLLLTALSFFTSTVFAEKSIKPLTLDAAVDRVKKNTGERVLSAKEVDKKGDHYYLIKTMKKGRVRLIRIDPETGMSY